MNLVKAFQAFLQVFFGGGECEHATIGLAETPAFCPQCGYRVKLQWLFVHCRNCNARRIPSKTLLTGIRPLHQFCRHCGQQGFKIVKKDRIDAYELLYAIGTKSTVYTDEPMGPSPIYNPFQTTVSVEGQDVVDAEILSRTEYRGTKSAFNTSPFEWQRNQNPSRYGGTYKSGRNNNVFPFRQP